MYPGSLGKKAPDPGSGSAIHDHVGEDFEPVLAMLMTTREDILERVARILIRYTS
jgi:hypothetical protein